MLPRFTSAICVVFTFSSDAPKTFSRGVSAVVVCFVVFQGSHGKEACRLLVISLGYL